MSIKIAKLISITELSYQNNYQSKIKNKTINNFNIKRTILKVNLEVTLASKK